MDPTHSNTPINPKVAPSRPTTLRSLGLNEAWLQDWIVADPTRLGLGSIVIKAKELRQYNNKGGRLDVLAFDAALDTYYEIEIMLGECDADHGFRALDYWAREKIKNPNARHVAVIVAEDLSGRYRPVIETLAQHLPLIAVELRTLWVLSEPPVATTFPVVVAQPDDLVLRPADAPGGELDPEAPNDEALWQSVKPEFTRFARDMHKQCSDKIGPSTINFAGKSYVSLKKGKRAWLAMWPNKKGAYVYIPGGPGGAIDQPSDFFAEVKNSMGLLGVEPSWVYKYNAGANPIAFQIDLQYISHSEVLKILDQAYNFA